MPLTSLRLQDFRCYTSLRCPLTAGTTLFTGDNAQGKTSLLEAVCVLLRLQSPRCQGTAELVRFGAQEFGVAGTLHGRELRHLAGQARALTLDGAPVRRTADYLAASTLVVWMGNSDIELISGSSDARRRYLDFLGTQLFPEYRTALRSYEKALRARNLLLKRDASPPWREIEAWTPLLIEHGTALHRFRAALIESLAPHAATAHIAIGGQEESLALTYEPSPSADDYAAELHAARAEESRRRVTFLGPHRDDFAITINQLPAARFASEGQQRTIALALKLAQSSVLTSHHTRPPVLLLDDIFGELDPRRRNALLRFLPPDSQKLITTTHLHWLDGSSLQPTALYQVSRGTLTPVN